MAEDVFDRLYPALVQAFVVIIAGYLAGRFGSISAVQSQGISTYVARFALPALLFRNMCTLDFGTVDWMFLLGICVAKTAIFVLVGLVTGLAIRPRHWGKVGLYGIFATQSNDFALFYPIILALYSETHPEFVKYLYLIAPISVIFLNPVGFSLLEVHKWQNLAPTQRTSIVKAAWSVLKGVLLNPIVFMSALGICGNFIFHQHVPAVMDGILKVLGDSFAATALFYLGVSMVGKIQNLEAKSFVAPAMLICAKMLLLPFLAREVTIRLLDLSHSGHNLTSDLANYAFLYGTVPTAPPVYLFAVQYGVATDTVGTGLVVGTFLSAPLMFVSVKMAVMQSMPQSSYRELLRSTAYNSSILSIIATVLVLSALFVSRRYRGIPHQFVFCLAVSQLLIAVGAIMWQYAASVPQWFFYVYFVVFYVGLLASHCWIAMTAVGVCVLRVRGLCYALKIRTALYFGGFGVPVFLTGLLLLVTQKVGYTAVTPGYALGQPQYLMTLSLIFVNIIIIIASVIAIQRHDKTYLSVRSRTTSTNENVTSDEEGDGRHSEDVTSSGANQSPATSSRTNLSTGAVTVPNGNGTVLGSPVHEEVSALGHSLDSRRHNRRVFSRKKKPLPAKKVCSECGEGQGCGTSIEDLVPFPDRAGTSAPARSFIHRSQEATETSPLLGSVKALDEEGEIRRACQTSGTCTERGPAGGCPSLVSSYQNTQFSALSEEEVAIALSRDRYQITRHLVLVLVLLVTLFIGLFLQLWNLFMEEMDGLYIELEFLNLTLTFGQGVITFVVFGLDTEMVLSPFMKKIRWLVFGREIQLTLLEDLDPGTKQTCQQFSIYHKQCCEQEIVGCRRYLLRTYRKVFTGTDLVDWLIDSEMVANRDQAVVYGKQLLEGRVIEHVRKERHFCDLPYVYQFVENAPQAEECRA